MRPLLTGTAIGGVLGAVLVGFAAFAWPQEQRSTPSDPRAITYQQIELFAEIFARAQRDYVVPIDEREAMSAAINGMLTSLDPHSGYLDPEDFRSLQVATSGEYGGLGIEVTMEDGFVKVISPMDDTPADRAGIQPGDYITAINGRAILGQTLNDAVREMRGEKGTPIELTILREGSDPFQVTLVREVIRPRIVSWRKEDDNIAYIRVSTFNERTGALLEDALSAIGREIGPRPRGLVLDLRNNGGGLLDEAVKVADFFLSGGEVVSTQGRRPIDVERRNASRAEVFKDVPIVVLINGGSASASEIVAGALQDRGRALVIGTTSFGKGSVQSVIPLGADRGAIRLTTARYYTPAGRSIQALGIEPDLMVTQVRLTEEELARIRRFSEADLPHAMQNENGEQRNGSRMPDEQPPEDYEGTDFQLERALAVLKEGQAALSRIAMRRDNAG
ncbi:S41 family peptidase [Hyphomonas sp.]|uniref:S41 family peptidase n=1 Tax=Hyphomonas sp. TaxID=87 RepID=UPI00391CB174